MVARICDTNMVCWGRRITSLKPALDVQQGPKFFFLNLYVRIRRDGSMAKSLVALAEGLELGSQHLHQTAHAQPLITPAPKNPTALFWLLHIPAHTDTHTHDTQICPPHMRVKKDKIRETTMCLIKLSIALLDATFLKDHTGSRGIFKTHFRGLQRGEWILLSQCFDQRFLHCTSASVTFRWLWWNTMAKAAYTRKSLGLTVPKRTGYQVFKYVSLWQRFLVQATTTLITFQKFFLQSQPPAGVHWDFKPWI